jgi:hypothetical protein
VSWLIAEFRRQEMLVDAIRDLRGSGLSVDDLDIFSEEPVELRRGILDRPSKMSLVAVITAIVFGAAATSFVYFAQNNYKLRSGGMPTFSMWGSGVITYEMTMFGAILAIFTMFLVESRLFRSRPKGERRPIPICPPNSICLRVRCTPAQLEMTASALREHGAVEVKQCD